MIHLPQPPLPQSGTRLLAEFHEKVTTISNYTDRVSQVDSLWSGIKRRNAFSEVRDTLAAMCNGPTRRCHYCEDAPADEVEHIWPKSHYPELTFVWENYLFACGLCNGPKNNRFALKTNSGRIDLTRKKGEPIQSPPTGDPLLIDPRKEDPMLFLKLDLKTFVFDAIDSLDAWDNERSEYTLEILGLNERAYLIEARRGAFGGFHARLESAQLRRNRGDSIERNLKSMREISHITVLREMIRQRESYPDWSYLFDSIPEALEL